jgi:hypothetical protein
VVVAGTVTAPADGIALAAAIVAAPAAEVRMKLRRVRRGFLGWFIGSPRSRTDDVNANISRADMSRDGIPDVLTLTLLR